MNGQKLKGFTLIELLVVIAIMSILTVITVSQFQTAQQKARDVQRKADLSSMAKALNAYYVDYGYFPKTLGSASFNASTLAMTDRNWCGSAIPCPGITDSTGYVYISSLPSDKKTSDAFCYIVDNPTKPAKYVLLTKLENTNDSECKTGTDDLPLYACGDSTSHAYCYSIFSTNVSDSDLTSTYDQFK